MTSKELAFEAVKILDNKKAEDITLIEIEELTIIADYFLLASATSNTHAKSLIEELEFQLEQKGVRADHIEGRASGWTLMDYGNVLIHIFEKDSREYYNLERLWSDAAVVDIKDLLTD
jgi:ribosome-associated protein